MVVKLPLVKGSAGLSQQLQPGDTIAGSGQVGVPVFGSWAEACASADGADGFQLLGYNSPGDNGGGAYKKVNSLPSQYHGTGGEFTPIPPNATSGGLPVLVFARTSSPYDVYGGPTNLPIIGGCLTFVVAFYMKNPPQPSFTDSVGNTFTLVPSGSSPGGTNASSAAIYFCSNPSPAPIGDVLDYITADNNGEISIYVYTVPGFTGALVDTAVVAVNDVGAAGGVSVPTGSLGAAPCLVVGMCNVGRNVFDGPPAFPYSLSAGWSDLSPPCNGRNVIACAVATSTAGITFAPTWSGTYFATTVLVAFKLFQRTSIDPSYYQLQPTAPIHIAQYGILPSRIDNAVPFLKFGWWLATTAAPSGTSYGSLPNLVRAGWCTIVGDTVTLSPPNFQPADVRNGAFLSFDTDGVLPSPLVAGKIYYAYWGSIASPTSDIPIAASGNSYDNSTGVIMLKLPSTAGLTPGPLSPSGSSGTVTLSALTGTGAVASLNGTWVIKTNDGATTVTLQATASLGASTITGGNCSIAPCAATQTALKITDTNIFQGGTYNAAKGTPITTSGGSGRHYYTTYGESYTEFVIDPGIYYASANAFPGPGLGLKKLRILAYGAHIHTNTNIQATPYTDVNAATNGYNLAYSTQFDTTTEVGTGVWPDHVIVDPATIDNFHINSWVFISCNEMLESVVGNPNSSTFEFVKIKSKSGGNRITFWDQLQYNYRSDFPVFPNPIYIGLNPKVGPGTIWQLNDAFDQEIEVYGLSIYGVTEENWQGILSLKMVECEIFGWGFKSGPFPSTMRSYIAERCKHHNYIPEIDKNVDLMRWSDCDFDQGSNLFFQSASTNKVIIERGRMKGGIGGSPKDLTVLGTFVAGSMALSTVYGISERVLLENDHIQSLTADLQSGATQLPLVQSGYSFVGGTIRVAAGTVGPYGTWWGAAGNPSPPYTNECPILWAVPGGKIAIRTNLVSNGVSAPVLPQYTFGMLTAFTVLDTYIDGSDNFSVDTDMEFLPSTTITFTATVSNGSGGSGNRLNVTGGITPSDACLLAGMIITQAGLPGGSATIASDLGIPNATSNIGVYLLDKNANIGSTTFTASVPMTYVPHPCPRLTVINCTGGRFVTDQAGAPSDIPMFSYFKRAFAGFPISPASRSESYVNVAGNLVSWEINVLKPYTGAEGTYTSVITMFGWKNVSGNFYPTFVQQTVNLKTAGIRTVTAGNTSGGVAGDTLVAVPFWLTGGHLVVNGPVADGGDTLAKMPKIVMTCQTNQGIDFASMVVSTPTSGLDELADTVMQAAIN